MRTKYAEELAFWKSRLVKDQGTFQNKHYERIMLGMAQESSQSFLRGRVVADFGCGPRGSLVWADAASLRIGIDVLADAYANAFTDNVIFHNMIYLKSTEEVIPLPSNFVDILFTLNAVDHVANLPLMCREMIRILKPGGSFIGSFNLEEPPTVTEPQRLTESLIQASLLRWLEIGSYRLSNKGSDVDEYAPLLDGTPAYRGGEGFLWVRARKPGTAAEDYAAQRTA